MLRPGGRPPRARGRALDIARDGDALVIWKLDRIGRSLPHVVGLGVVRAAGLTRVLQTNDRPTRLARALQELGRLVKSLYLLRFIDDESYRRRILVQLNRGEGRHQLARVIVHGKRGELRQRYREW